MIERFRVPVDEYVRRSEENLASYEAMRQHAGRRTGRSSSSAASSTPR